MDSYGKQQGEISETRIEIEKHNASSNLEYEFMEQERPGNTDGTREMPN